MGDRGSKTSHSITILFCSSIHSGVHRFEWVSGLLWNASHPYLRLRKAEWKLVLLPKPIQTQYSLSRLMWLILRQRSLRRKCQLHTNCVGKVEWFILINAQMPLAYRVMWGGTLQDRTSSVSAFSSFYFFTVICWMLGCFTFNKV